MQPRSVWILAAMAVLTAPVSAAPPVTSPHAPAPGPAQARLWLEAILQAPWVQAGLVSGPRSDAVRMLLAVQNELRLGPGVGWYDPSQRRHDWAWLAARFPVDAEGRIVRSRFPATFTAFDRLDRNRDGALTAADLDWSEHSDWVRLDAQALRLLRAIDSDGNGQVAEEEWLAFYKKLASARGHLSTAELHEALAGGDRGRGRKVSTDVWLRCLLAGDLGSPFSGPGVGQEAPDFTLPTHDGTRQVTLSEFRGKKPVVLVFGSFT